MQTICMTANTIWDLSSGTRISLPRENIHLQQMWYQLQCPSVQPFLLISHNLLYKSDTFLTSPATEQLRMTDSISKVSSCCSVLEKTNLIMTHGFFTTSFMLPGLIRRSLEIRAYCTCKETLSINIVNDATFCVTTIYDLYDPNQVKITVLLDVALSTWYRLRGFTSLKTVILQMCQIRNWSYYPITKNLLGLNSLDSHFKFPISWALFKSLQQILSHDALLAGFLEPQNWHLQLHIKKQRSLAPRTTWARSHPHNAREN